MTKNRFTVAVSVLTTTFIFLSSCSQLKPDGVMVDVRNKISVDDLEEYEKVGRVACRNEIYLVTKAHNHQLCTDRLRNSAAELGADFIKIEREIQLPGWFSTGYEIRATAYKKRHRVDQAPSTSN